MATSDHFRKNFVHGMGSVIVLSPTPRRRFSYRAPQKDSAQRAWESVASAWRQAVRQADDGRTPIHDGFRVEAGSLVKIP